MKDLIKDFATPFKEAFVSRLASPLTIGYLISWSIYNYKLIIILWSNNQVSTIFDLIQKHVFRDFSSSVASLIIPLGCSLAYIFIYDPFASWIHVMKLKRDTTLENAKKAASGAKLLSMQESEEILASNKKLEIQHLQDIDELRKREIEVAQELETTRKTLNAVSEQLERLKNPTFDSKALEEDHIAILGKLQEGRASSTSLKKLNNANPAMIDSRLRELINFGLVNRTAEHDGSVYYGLSSQGKNILARDGL